MTLFMLSDGVTCINLDYVRLWEIHLDTNIVVHYDERSIATHYSDDDAAALIVYASKNIAGQAAKTKVWKNKTRAPVYTGQFADPSLPPKPIITNNSTDPKQGGLTNG